MEDMATKALWIAIQLIGLYTGLKLMVTSKISVMAGRLDNHIEADRLFQINMLAKITENTEETKKNSKTSVEYNENSHFFGEIINIGVLAIVDIEKHNKEECLENRKEANKKANEYVNVIIGSLSSLSRDILTLGVEDVTKEFVYSKSSNIIQNATKLYDALYGQEHSVKYINSGGKDRNIFIEKIFTISEDIANNKTDRFRKATLDYAHDMLAGFCRYYYTHKLNKVR